jgi:hypothetical protein
MIVQPAMAAPQTLVDQQAEDAQYYRRVLHELIDTGVGLVRLVSQPARSQGEAAAAPTADPALVVTVAIAFDRISRAVRRTIALARKVAEPVALAAAHPAQHREAARRRIIREVEDVIQRTAGHAEAENLHAELLDRLDAPDLDDDIGQRPIADIIADICRDLGLAAQPGTHPWKRRTTEDLTTLRVRAAMLRAPIPDAAAPPAAAPPAAAPSAAAPSAAAPAEPPTTSRRAPVSRSVTDLP